jgi:hypothetical protein
MCEWGSWYLSHDIISFCVTSSHFWWFEILGHSFYFAIFFVIQMFCFSMFKVWILALLQVSQSCWMWCTIQSIFILCVVSVVTLMVIGMTDIALHTTFVSHWDFLAFGVSNFGFQNDAKLGQKKTRKRQSCWCKLIAHLV